MSQVAIVIPTFNNFNVLVHCLESIRDYTDGVDWRLIVVDNGSTDDTSKYLNGLVHQGVPLTPVFSPTNLGFVKGTNAGLGYVLPGEHVCLCNDDIQITDPLWLKKMVDDLNEPGVGAVGVTSNYVMGLQGFTVSYQIPKRRHTSHLLIYFCGLISAEAFQKVGMLDERFGRGGNDDLDYSIRLHEAGYKILIDRTIFTYHFGSQTLIRTEGSAEGISKLDKEKRAILVEKWGQDKVDWLFQMPEDLMPEQEEEYGASYYARFGHGGYQRNAFWLEEWGRIASKIITTLHPRTVFDAGCAHGMLVEALVDQGRGGVQAYGMDVSSYAIGQAREDIRDRLKVGSIAKEAPFTIEDMDLVTCIEVLEHLTADEAERAVSNLCFNTKTILFSSTPTDKDEPTHRNVQPRAYWVSLFKKFGFVPDESYDASYLTQWAILFRRNY